MTLADSEYRHCDGCQYCDKSIPAWRCEIDGIVHLKWYGCVPDEARQKKAEREAES